MAATARVALGASELVKGWYVDVNTGTTQSPTWTPVSGITKCKPTNKATLKDDSDFDGGGAQSQVKTADQWGLEISLRRAGQTSAATAYDPGAEKLRALSLLYGSANIAHVRYYEVNGSGHPVTEAWEGYAVVEWNEANEAVDDPRMVEVTLTGRGARTPITPNPGSA